MIFVHGSGVRCLWDRSLLHVVTAIVLQHLKAGTPPPPSLCRSELECVI